MIDLNELYRNSLEAYPLLTVLVVGGTLICLLGLVLQRLASSSSAAQRHLILSATTIALLAIPLAHMAGPQLSLPIPPSSPTGPSGIEETPAGELTRRNDAVSGWSAVAASPASGSLPSGSAGPSPSGLVAVVYFVGFVLVLVPLVAGSLRMKSILRDGELLPEDEEIADLLDGRRSPEDLRIMTSGAVKIPLAWGWRRPVLLLPSQALAWPREMRRDAIIHELAHLDRRDLWFQTIGRIAVAVHWFNPLSWAVLRRLLLEAEQACDDRVLHTGTGTADYAERLLQIASDANHRSLRRLSAVAMARSSQLATRIESLFETSRKRSVRLSAWRSVATFLLLIAPAALIGAVQFEESPGSPVESARSHQQGERVQVTGKSWHDEADADESPLYSAIRYGDVAMVESILSAGADPNARWRGDGTPLIIAVRHHRHDVIDLLLERGARPDEGVEGDGNALIVAAGRGDLRSLEKFIATGADIDRGVPGDGNPLIAAAAAGQLEAMKLLVSHGADIEAVVPGDENPLIQAAEQGELEAARYLISVGADVNARVVARSWKTGETEVRTPLSRARGRGDETMVRLLISAGAKN